LDAINFILKNALGGIFNLCTPYPVDNATFTRKLAEYRGTKLIIRIPTWVFRIVLGEAHTMITEGPNVLPVRLLKEGYQFSYPGIGDALQNLVQKN
jgi:hypothetical protein